MSRLSVLCWVRGIHVALPTIHALQRFGQVNVAEHRLSINVVFVVRISSNTGMRMLIQQFQRVQYRTSCEWGKMMVWRGATRTCDLLRGHGDPRPSFDHSDRAGYSEHIGARTVLVRRSDLNQWKPRRPKFRTEGSGQSSLFALALQSLAITNEYYHVLPCTEVSPCVVSHGM